MTNTAIPKGKNKAVIANITFIGMFIAISMNNNDGPDIFATKHIRHMFGLFIIFICSQVIVAYVSSALGDIIFLVSIILWIYSIVAVSQNKEPNIPFLSEKFQEWFTFLD